MLKKEFKRKDVNRARNLLTGKTNASTGVQIGYSTKQEDHKEGDVWTEKKKTWTIKNGIKQTVSKLDAIKKEVFMPLCCPNCGKVMKGQLDKPNYKIHKKCHSCVVEFEHKLRIRGEYDDYIKNLRIKNSFTVVDEMESYLLDVVNNTSNSEFVSEDGVVERWVGGANKTKLKNKVKEEFAREKEKLKKELNDKKGT